MLRLRVLVAAACGLAGFLVFGVPTAAPTDPFPGCSSGSYVTLASTHFLIHYCDSNDAQSVVSEAKAGDILGWAERSLATYESWGYPTPPLDVADADGLYDIYVKGLPSTVPTSGAWTSALVPDGPGALIEIQADSVTLHEVAHDVFHLFQLGVAPSFVHLGETLTSDPDLWLQESTAEWAAYTMSDYAGAAGTLGAPDASGDCVGAWCGATEDENSGHPGWGFFEYLSERYGAGIVKDIWNKAAADGTGPGTAPVDEVLAAKGSSLEAAYGNYAVARLNPTNPSTGFTLLALEGETPPLFSTIATGATSGPITPTIVAVNHFASRYLALQPGDGTTGSLCYTASLALTLAIPSGIGAKPWVSYLDPTANTNVKPLDPKVVPNYRIDVPFTVSGSTATVTIPWNTCTGSGPAYVLLPNPNIGDPTAGGAPDNGEEFTLSGTLTVDTNSVASPTPPPAPVAVNGSVVNVPTSAVPPDIDVFGPEIIHLSTSDTTLRLIVHADTDGKLQGSLGSYALGTATLRAGGNDVRFSLPAGARVGLRRAAATSNVLQLTSIASSGVLGETVTRLVTIDPAKPKPKKHAKPKPKKKKHVKAKAKKKTTRRG
jgi:hypothetical protein